MSWDEKQGEQEDQEEEDALLDMIEDCVQVIQRFGIGQPEVQNGTQEVQRIIKRVKGLGLAAT
jgi:hypothetical protein